MFQGSMTGRSEQEAGDVVAAYDFGGLGRLVDVGGGYGILLGATLEAAPLPGPPPTGPELTVRW